ncbi:glucose-6-phosphate isomerase [Erysipelotrichaceae bacterium MTC7]|nr:glucose-6-phosphate isomerase [Erysipelotrichaceae bacterium MTC7]
MKNFGIDVRVQHGKMDFMYGKDVIGPKPEIRRLDDIRSSLQDPKATGPEELYCIAMDVYRKQDRQRLDERNLLFGSVTYSKGQIGKEPVRSQGHIHATSPSCNCSTCEVYEIWEGEAYIYMQKSGADDAGSCYAVHAKAGDVVVVPPGWVHATINADISSNMTFGAWCVKDYGFDYQAVREHKGIAFFPEVEEETIVWKFNEHYKTGDLQIKEARDYPELNITSGVPIYEQFIENPDKFLFVSKPSLATSVWQAMDQSFE